LIVSDVCKKCGGVCCKGEITGHPKCKWLSDTGCILCPDCRGTTCSIFPFVIIEDIRLPKPRRVFLDTACPYYYEFINYRDQIKDTDECSMKLREDIER